MFPVIFLTILAQNAYVNTSNGLAVIDTGSGQTTSVTTIGAGNGAVAPDGTRVYVTQTGAATVLSLDPTTNSVVATIPVGNGAAAVAVSPDSKRAYATNLLDGTLSAIDAASNRVIATIPVGKRPFGVAISVDGTKVYVANTAGPSVSVVSTATNTLTSTITLPFPSSPFMVAFSPDGLKAYVTDSGYGNVFVISTITDTIVNTFQAAFNNQAVAFTPNGAQAYITNLEGSVIVVDAVTDALVAAVPLGGVPAGVAFSRDGTKAYVANNALSEVQVVDTGSFAVATIPVSSHPTGFGIFIQPGGAPVVSAVGNGFTFIGGAAPGSFIAITGVNLASQTASFVGRSLPLAIGATSVLLNGRPIPLYYVSPTQINAQLPLDTAVTISSLDVMNGSQMSNRASIAVFDAAPGIPYYLIGLDGHAAARNGDGSINSPSNPAAPGSVVTVYFTGIGPVTNPVASGAVAPVSPLSNSELAVVASIGGQTVVPSFAGLSPGSIGLAQANLQVPVLPAGDYPVSLTVGIAVSNAPLLSVGH